MSPAPDGVLADPQQTLLEVKRQLAEAAAERDEALRREIAVGEVLQVVNASRGELAPVFDAMLEKALRVCEAVFGVLVTVDGEQVEFVAQRNVPQELTDFIARGPMRLDPATILGRAIIERRVVHTLDNADSDAYRERAPLGGESVHDRVSAETRHSAERGCNRSYRP